MSTALVEFRERRKALVTSLEKVQPTIARLLPTNSDAEAARLIRIVHSAVARNPTILTCHPPTIVQAVLQGAECGLEIGGVRGEAYLVPFWNSKANRRDCQFIAGYKGLVRLMLQTPTHRNLEARLVYDGDTYERVYGSSPGIVHRPGADVDRTKREIVAAYAVLHFTDDRAPQFEDMDRMQLDRVRNRVRDRNRGRDLGPWATDTDAMFRKCPIRAIANMVELSPRARKAIEYDHLGEMPALLGPREAGAPTRADTLRAKLSGAPADAPSDPIDTLAPEELEGELVDPDEPKA